MTAFQVITIILTGLGLLGAIVAVYVRSQVDIAKINTSIMFFQKDLDRKEISICRLESENKADHEKILKKFDELINK